MDDDTTINQTAHDHRVRRRSRDFKKATKMTNPISLSSIDRSIDRSALMFFLWEQRSARLRRQGAGAVWHGATASNNNNNFIAPLLFHGVATHTSCENPRAFCIVAATRREARPGGTTRWKVMSKRSILSLQRLTTTTNQNPLDPS
jgi:hypothetical protein